MNTQTSFYIAIISIILVVAAPFIWFPCGESPGPGNVAPAGTGPTGCQPNGSFEIQFDQTQCSIKLDNIGLPSCQIEASADGGVSWVPVRNGDELPLIGTGACDVKLRSVSNPGGLVSYSGTQVCNCTPQVNISIIEDLVEDPLNHFLDGKECRCSDFTFIFPDGNRINAVEVTLYLKMNRLNGIEFQIDEVDFVNQQVLLLNR